jgi:acetoin utilization deacetylase AcuC-like enzyme
MTVPIAFISHADCLLHDVGHDHPEQPARLNAIQDRLISSGMEFVVLQHDAPMAARQHLERVHDHDHISRIIDEAPQEGILRLDDETFMMPQTLNAALRSAGAVVYAVDLVMQQETRIAFCSIRPPGHHAERCSAMGFCYFNNIAVGAAHALEEYGVERIAIIDFDVHHGNGTEDIFRDDPRVFFGSSFQHPFYPDVGYVTGSKHIVNIPLPAGTAGNAYQELVEERWLPALDAFRPQLIFISAGFDGHIEDHMSHIRLREADYSWVTTKLKAIADKHTGGRIISVLEGGYALSALGRSVVAHLDALLGS